MVKDDFSDTTAERRLLLSPANALPTRALLGKVEWCRGVGRGAGARPPVEPTALAKRRWRVGADRPGEAPVAAHFDGRSLLERSRPGTPLQAPRLADASLCHLAGALPPDSVA